jgi:hypothetical protein
VSDAAGGGRGCCTVCRQYFGVEWMDLVAVGTGYRCPRCSQAAAVEEQLLIVAENERIAREESDADTGVDFDGPDLSDIFDDHHD